MRALRVTPLSRAWRAWPALAVLAGIAATATLVSGRAPTPDVSGSSPSEPKSTASPAPNGAAAAAVGKVTTPVRRAGEGAKEALKRQFPGQASLVTDSGGHLIPAGNPTSPDGYYRMLAPGLDGDVRAPAMSAHLPARGTEPVRFRVPSGFAVDVREPGTRGAAQPAGRAVAYERDGGYAFWSANDDGYEEWLLVSGGRPDDVASWVVPQGTLRQDGDAVEVLDEKGEPQIRITAPRAYRSGGVKVAAHVRADRNRVVLGVDMPGDRFEEPLLVDPLWQVTASAPEGHVIHAASRLNDGRVLIVGGTDHTNNLTGATSIFDPVTETWQQASPLFDVVYAAAAVTLLDGRVLLSNGGGSSQGGALAGLYDPVLDTWTPADPTRSLVGPGTALGEVSVRLPDGKVLMTGNYCCPGNEAHIYDPVTDTVHPVASMVKHRLQHTLTLLPDGTVLAAGGGTTNASSLNSNTAEIFIPDTSGPQPDYLNGTWQQVGNMSSGHADGFAVKLTTGPNAGKAMVCNGFDGATFPGSYFFTNACEIYDPITQTFSLTGYTNYIRQLSGTGNGGSVAAVIEAGSLTGHVLAAGGYPYMSEGEMYDPVTGVWQTMCPLLTPRLRHTTTALTDGRVLLAGGQNFPGSQALVGAEIMNPTAFIADTNCNGVPDPIESCFPSTCVQVTGTVSADTLPAGTPNCALDPGETGVVGRMVRADDGFGTHYYAVTDAAGNYTLTLPQGTSFNVSLVPNAYMTESPACGGPQVYSPNAFASTSGVDFSLQATCIGTVVMSALPPNDPNACPNLIPPHYASPCPGSPWRYCATVTNTGTMGFTNGLFGPSQVILYPSSPDITYASVDLGTTTCPGSIDMANTGPGGLYWNLGSIPANTQCQVCMNVTVSSPPTGCYNSAAILDAWCSMVDNYGPLDTHQECSQCSCDPNDKSVSPEGCGPSHLIAPQDLKYTVRFQNVGAGPAHNVVIRDDIDPNLDIETLQVVASSHPISEVRVVPPQGLVVSFNGIELPAAQFDADGSHGYVILKIAPRPGLPPGTTLSNFADIYFDNNPPVTTNSVDNTLNPAPTGEPTCVTIQRGVLGNVEDTHIASDKPTKNWGTSQSLAVGSVPPGQRQALVKWDLSAIPSCATIVSATAKFDVLLHGGAPMSLHRIAAGWSEPTVTQQLFGRRYEREVSIPLPAAATPSADVTTLVQAWVDGTLPNHGVLIDQDPGAQTVLHSSESTSVARRPRLEVCYHPAP